MASALMAPEKRHLSDAEQNGYSHYETWLAHYTLWNWSDTVSDEYPEGGTKSDWTQEAHDLYKEWQEYGDDNDSLQEWITHGGAGDFEASRFETSRGFRIIRVTRRLS